MKNDRWMRYGVLALIVALAAPCLLGLDSRAAARQMTIEGTVKRAEVNSKGEVRRVYIEDESGEAYLVMKRGKGKELLTQSREKVQASGYVSKSRMDQSFNFVIDVTEYTILENGPSAQAAAHAAKTTGK